METIIILTATVVAFSLFLLVYFIKGRSDTDNTQSPACARCDCQRRQQQHVRPFRNLEQIEKEIRPCSTAQ